MNIEILTKILMRHNKDLILGEEYELVNKRYKITDEIFIKYNELKKYYTEKPWMMVFDIHGHSSHFEGFTTYYLEDEDKFSNLVYKGSMWITKELGKMSRKEYDKLIFTLNRNKKRNEN